MIRTSRFLSLSCVFALLCAGTLLAQSDSDHEHEKVHTEQEGPGSPEIIPHRTNTRTAAPPAGSTGTQSPAISYHGGPLMGTPNVYLIWYGNWNQTNNSDTPAGQDIIRDLLTGLSGSSYYLTNTSYNTPTGNINLSTSEYTDNYSHSARLSDSRVQQVVISAISKGHLPLDANGIYFVLTSSDVSESSGFCSRYCGWHTSVNYNGTDIKYSFVGNAKRCLNGCAAQAVGPNGNPGVDGMASVVTHELEETNTDPDGNAWYDSNGAEDADKCAWTFGSALKTDNNGAYYNLTLLGRTGNYRNFLIQRELDSNSVCYIDYANKIQ